MRRLMDVKPSSQYQVTPVLHEVESAQTKHSRESPCKSGHELWQEKSNVEIGQMYARELFHSKH